MNRITTAHTQELVNVLAAARIFFFDERKTAIQSEMLRSSIGALFCQEGAEFGDTLTAYAKHARRVPELLAEVAIELEQRKA